MSTTEAAEAAVVQCITDLRHVWQKQASLPMLDLAMASLRDDALLFLQCCCEKSDVLQRIEQQIIHAISVYCGGGLMTDLESAFTALFESAKKVEP